MVRLLFPWLEDVKKNLALKTLKVTIGEEIYAYLAERYLSFWFKKYTNFKEQP